MNPTELEMMIRHHPRLFHMAERGSWPSIKKHGLLSTTALLDLYSYVGHQRSAIETVRRPEFVRIEHPDFGVAVIRDQKPMTDAGLKRALQDELTPSEWYRILNKRVFFWLTEERLYRLLNASPYQHQNHDVLIVLTRPLIENYRDRITLCPMNSGATRPFAHPRGLTTFLPIDNYPYSIWRAKRGGKDSVVELAIEDGVPDIARYVERVDEMRGSKNLGVVWERT